MKDTYDPKKKSNMNLAQDSLNAERGCFLRICGWRKNLFKRICYPQKGSHNQQ